MVISSLFERIDEMVWMMGTTCFTFAFYRFVHSLFLVRSREFSQL